MNARIAALRFAKLCAILGVALSCATHAQDWPQWRGPKRDGVVPATHAPKSWPDSLRRVWRVEIGEGYSSPIVAEGRVFIHSRRDPEEVVSALDRASGKILWQEKYPAALEKNRYATKMTKGPNATPLFAGNRLFTLGATGVLSAWDVKSGRLLWRNDFSKTVETSKLFCGTAASPLLLDDRIVVQVGSDIHGGKILALDPASGATKWEWRGHGPGYASPVVFDIAGTRQIVTMTDSSILGLDAKNGKQLWYVPFLDDWHENITTPVWTGALLIVSGTRQGTHAYALERQSGEWRATEVWKNDEVAMYMSSPVLGEGLIYGHSVRQKGQFVALDPKTGALRWASTGREGWHASVLLAPQHVLFLTNGGEMIVAQRKPDAFEVEHRYQVAQSETFAMPVILGDDLFVRDVSGISRWSAKR
jgi:outer membrane protein assembly factor BamB